MCCNLTVLHSFWVFIWEMGGRAVALTFAAPCIRWCALGLLGLVNLLWGLAVAVLFPLTLLVGQLPVQSRCRCLVGFFHFEEHRRGGTVLHGPEFTDRKRTVLGSQHYEVTNTIMLLRVGGKVNSKSQSPFLGAGLDGCLLKFRLLVLRLHTNSVWVVPQLVLLQAHLCCKHCFTVGTAMTQLLCYSGLIQTET